jgi:hypothetical protein
VHVGVLARRSNGTQTSRVYPSSMPHSSTSVWFRTVMVHLYGATEALDVGRPWIKMRELYRLMIVARVGEVGPLTLNVKVAGSRGTVFVPFDALVGSGHKPIDWRCEGLNPD